MDIHYIYVSEICPHVLYVDNVSNSGCVAGRGGRGWRSRGWRGVDVGMGEEVEGGGQEGGGL